MLAAVAFVLGGVLAVRPTKAQQRIAEIREKAIRAGMHVKLPVSLRFPEKLEKGRSPYYCKHVKSKDFYQSFYCVFRDDDRVRTSAGDLATTLKTGIDNILISASKDIDGFYLGEGLIGFSWQESDKQEIFDELCVCIDHVERLLSVNA